MSESAKFPRPIRAFVRGVDAVNRVVGLFAMYLIFLMLAVLMWSSLSKTFFTPSLWTLEVAQFTMVAYYLLGGGYSLLKGDHVRMDLLYSRWSKRQQAMIDSITILFVMFFMGVLLYGGISSTQYALQYGEESRSIWGPKMAPIKIIMDVGIFLALLQTISIFFKSLAAATGRDIT